ncbi:MAG: hypothetical protein IT548_18960 [Alphaproteobacteria bacterium]|nr:hypothetical protein [Alphaproteobacteria bacterium]
MLMVATLVLLLAGAAQEPALDLRLSEACDPATRHKRPTQVPQGCPSSIPSPDGTLVANVVAGLVSVVRNGRSFAVASMGYGRILWRPDSQGFAIADNVDSGQTEIFSYVDTAAPVPVQSTRLGEAALQRFGELFHCRGDDWYANTFTDGWTPEGDVRLVTQGGLHSEGCNDMPAMLGVIGDPMTGRIREVLTADQVRAHWCTAAQRLSFGYCWDEAAAVRSNRQP